MSSKTKLVLEISEELKSALEKIASESSISIEMTATNLLAKSLKKEIKPTNTAEDENCFSSVALVKSGSKGTNSFQKTLFEKASQPSPLITSSAPFASTLLNISQNFMSDEKIERRAQIDAQMKELSLLLTTATEDGKKEEYSLQYAILASELDSII